MRTNKTKIIFIIWTIVITLYLLPTLANFFDVKEAYINKYYDIRERMIDYEDLIRQGYTKDEALEKIGYKMLPSYQAMETYYSYNVKPFLDYFYPEILMKLFIIILITQILIGALVYYDRTH